MPMTESKARETWCPHVRQLCHFELEHGVVFGGINRWNFEADAARCIASRCQMWEWDNRGGVDQQHRAHEAVVAFAKQAGVDPPPPPAVEHVGYCGLARGPR